MADECVVCGRRTGPGTPLYVGRRRLSSTPPGTSAEGGQIVELGEPAGFICGDCDTPAAPETDSFKAPSTMIGAASMQDALLHRGQRKRR